MLEFLLGFLVALMVVYLTGSSHSQGRFHSRQRQNGTAISPGQREEDKTPLFI